MNYKLGRFGQKVEGSRAFISRSPMYIRDERKERKSSNSRTIPLLLFSAHRFPGACDFKSNVTYVTYTRHFVTPAASSNGQYACRFLFHGNIRTSLRDERRG